MARRVRASTLENRTARLKLEPRKKPYHFTTIAPGSRLAIAAAQGRADGCCAPPMVTARTGPTPSRSPTITSPPTARPFCTFWQAQDKARVLVRGEDAAGDRPATVAEALDAYERDLATRGGAVANARVVRKLIPAALLAKPVGLLTFRELRHWRDGLLDGRKASSVNRTCKSLKAALNLAAAHDPRIGNAAVWRSALAGLPDAHTARHVGLPERDVRNIVVAAYAVAPQLGLWTEVAATTGARPSQIARLDVADLQDDRDDPRLMMPSSKKGRGRKRIERRPVPIPPGLAAKLRHAAAGRPAGDSAAVPG